jgi:hypothetical protein
MIRRKSAIQEPDMRNRPAFIGVSRRKTNEETIPDTLAIVPE